MRKLKLLKLAAVFTGITQAINKWIEISSTSSIHTENEGKVFHSQNGDIYYNQYGSGKESVLLLHDLSPFMSSYVWDDVVDSLAQEYTLYIPDLPGCGKSCNPDQISTTYYYAQFIRDFIQKVIGDKTTVVACGYSASAAISSEVLFPDHISRLIMVNPSDPAAKETMVSSEKRTINNIFRMPIIGNTLYYYMTSRNKTSEYIEEDMLCNPFHVKHSLYRSAYQAAHYGRGRGKYLLISLKSGYLHCSMARMLTKTDIPVKIVMGGQVRGQKEVCSAYKKIRADLDTYTIAEAKLAPQIEQPQEFVECLRKWL